MRTRVVAQIVRFVEWHQPPIVACEFVDSDGRTHTFIDKVWIFAADTLDQSSEYPQPGHIRCDILDQWQDERGYGLARVSTRVDSVESVDGLTEFVVKLDQLQED